MEEIIVDENRFLASFGDWQYNQSKKYYLAKKLHQSISSVPDISRIINHPERTVRDWLNDKRTPFSVRALNYLKSIGLMPLKPNETPIFILFVELSAFLFGDGHLMNHLGAFSLFGQKEDLDNVADILFKHYRIKSSLRISYSSSVITRVRNGVVYRNSPKGYCYRLEVNNSPLARLLFLAGVPIGDKVSSSTKVPDWVVSSGKEIKRAFLSVLFGNELQCPFIRAKNAFTSAPFGLHKIESKSSDLVNFHKQIKSLLDDFGITSSPISEEKCRTLRKDGSLSKKILFNIGGRSPNILKLFQEIPFKYAEEKQEKFSEAVETFLIKVSGLKNEWGIYETVIELRGLGLSADKIFERLALPKNYIYKINQWIYYGQKPLYYDSRAVFESGTAEIANQ